MSNTVETNIGFKHKHFNDLLSKTITAPEGYHITNLGIIYTGNINKTYQFENVYQSSNNVNIYQSPLVITITFLNSEDPPIEVRLGKTGIFELHNVSIRGVSFSGTSAVEWDKLFVEYLQVEYLQPES